VQPLAGDQALRVIDVVGFLLVAPILFLLCRRQFSMTASALAAVSVGILPMLRNVAVEPMTDTFGLALEASALLVGLVTYERGLRWLPLWVATIAVLAFTRDAAVIPIVGVAWLLVLHRSRVAAAMVATGVAAAAPPFILFGGSLRRTLAYTFSGFNPPTRTSWSFILRRFPDALTNMVGDQIRYLFHHPGTALLFAVAAATLYLSRRRSTYLSFFRAAGLAAVGLAYSIPQNDPDLRLGLVVLPIVVVGVALAIDQLRTYVGRMPSAFRFLEPGWPHRG
jgi:hypothetical protein